MAAALVTLAAGYFLRNMIVAIVLGALTLYGGLAFLG
jgi:hypothetical protein